MPDEGTPGTEMIISLAKRLVFAILVLAVSFSVVSAGQNETTQKKIALLKKTEGAFSFVVLGDNRSGDDRYAKLISSAMERRPHFIINTGDQIPHPGDLDDWEKFWKLSAPVTVPYFLTVGNHDVKNAKSENIYRQQVALPGNELYYSFRVGASLFIVLDTYLTGEQKKIVGEQYRWLEEVLSKAKAKHIFVFLHHPLFPDMQRGHHYGSSLDKYPAERDRLQSLFLTYKVDIVFTGHEHLYLRKEVGGITHIITGGGGAPLYAREKHGGFHHFIQVTVDGDTVRGAVVDIHDTIRDRF